MKILTYNQDLNDVVSSLDYSGKQIIPYGVNTAVVSTVIKTDSVYDEGGIILILLLCLNMDQKVVLT